MHISSQQIYDDCECDSENNDIYTDNDNYNHATVPQNI